MSDQIDEELKKIMDEISKGSTHIVASPEVIQRMKDKGLPIVEKFITYEEYTEKLFTERKKDAVSRLRKLPNIDKNIADSVVETIIEEIRSSYAFGIFTSTIFNSILLLEYAMRSAIYSYYSRKKAEIEWNKLERMTMGVLIPQLFKLKLITLEEKNDLLKFNKKFRNPYLHINIEKMTEGIYYNGTLPGINVETKKKEELKNVEAKKHRFLWFSAKKFYDKFHVQFIIEYCIGWTNKLLVKKK